MAETMIGRATTSYDDGDRIVSVPAGPVPEYLAGGVLVGSVAHPLRWKVQVVRYPALAWMDNFVVFAVDAFGRAIGPTGSFHETFREAIAVANGRAEHTIAAERRAFGFHHQLHRQEATRP